MQQDLANILVISVEQAVAAPYATGRLADAGARVVKVERPEGDFARNYDNLVHGESAYFVWLNRGKESICLDLKDAADAAILSEMVARADVFVQNLLPGAIERLGLDLGRLRADNKRLITCSISGYGDTGPYRDQKAYDLLIQAESGLSFVTGNEAGFARVGVSVCDIAAGMTALQAILQALYAREHSGEGRHISVSLYHALADWMNVPYLQFAYGKQAPARSGLNHPTIAPYGAYVCSDNLSILISIQNEREWASFCSNVIGDGKLATDRRFATNTLRVANRQALDGIIAAVFGAAPRDEMVSKLAAARVAYGRVSTLDDVSRHPQNRYFTVETPTGPVKCLSPGAVFNERAQTTFGPVPALGEHSRQLRVEFAPPQRAQA
jgi:crotonobetainyl-CoA:carnitine CoA-transferase CaiB-like acyl-CoA transferase